MGANGPKNPLDDEHRRPKGTPPGGSGNAMADEFIVYLTHL